MVQRSDPDARDDHPDGGHGHEPEPPGRDGFRSRTFGALAHRNFRWILAGQFVSQSGSWLHAAALGIVVASTTGNDFYVGLVGFFNFVPALALGLVGGALADRFDRRRLIITMQVVEITLTATLALLFAFGYGQLWAIYTITLGLGIATAINGPAWFAFFPRLVPRESIPSAISLNAMQFNLARIVGPGIGGWLVATLGAAWAFGLNSLSFLALLLPLVVLRFPSEPVGAADPASARSGGAAQIAAAFRYVLRRRWLSTLLLTVVVQALFAAQVITLLPAFGSIDLGFGDAQVGWMFSAFGVGGLLGALSASNLVDRVPKRLLVPALIAAIGAAIVLLSVQTTVVGVLASLVVVGIVYTSGMSSVNAMLQLGVDEEMRGRVSSMWFTVFVGVFPLAALFWGWIAGKASTSSTFAVGGIVCIVYGAVVALRPGMFADDPSV